MIKTIIADDHTIVREGLKQILNETADVRVSDEAKNGGELLSKLRRGKFDVVVLDISMPGANGLDALKQIKIIDPHLPVLVLSMHPEEQYAVRVLKAGAAGYLTKESASEELLKAIRRIVSGGKYVSPSLAEKLAVELDTDRERPLYETLSDREYQVFCMIASGRTATEVAEELSLSVKTVSTYRSRILHKLHMANNAQLTHYAIKNGLV
ncbi:MAG: response regulator transcription factor [Spirochaetes bacterium]|nr:response regulator transcription factor [Spirochaetota bacterium]